VFFVWGRTALNSQKRRFLARAVVLNERVLGATKLNDMVEIVFGGRYVLLLMSLASIYCGAIYNETFGIPHDLFGSRWDVYAGENATNMGGELCAAAPATPASPYYAVNCSLPPVDPYPVGVDPAWKWSPNGLTFMNSLKMKMSIIFGVSQMVFGIILKGKNHLHELDGGATGETARLEAKLSLYFEFVPQLVFMLGIFGYMCLLIVLKWNICWVPEEQTTSNGGWMALNTYSCTGKLAPGDAPPDIKQIMIGMFMRYGQDDPTNYVLYSGMLGVRFGRLDRLMARSYVDANRTEPS
jgi:vacuolar-type H+-ATPase subunit I/STV1